MNPPPISFLPAAAFLLIAIACAFGSYRRAWFGPAAIVATAPFAWYHQLGPVLLTIGKTVFIGAIVGAAIAVWRDPARRSAMSSLRSEPALWFIAAFAALSLASVAWAGSAADAIRDSLRWAWYAGAFALAGAAAQRTDASKVCLALIASAAAVGSYGLYQAATAAPAAFVAGSGSVIGRVASTLEGPNQFGAYLESVIPVLAALLLLSRLPRVALAVGGLLLGLLVSNLLLTYSRGALWSCVAAVIVVVTAYLLTRRHAQTRAGSASAGAAATIAVCAALVVVPVARAAIPASGWYHSLWVGGPSDVSESAAERRKLWACAIVLARRHPILGVGAGNFADAKAQCPQALLVREHFNANEWYLETAADLGAVGTGLSAAFLIALLAAGRKPGHWRDPIAVGAYAVVIAFALHGLVDDVFGYPKASLALFVVAGLLLQSAAREQGRAPALP